MTFKKHVFLLIVLILGHFPLSGQKERIIDFHVQISVNPDRSIDVEEQIKVFANRQVINRGITRSLPQYRDMEGQKIRLKYRNFSIRKDGKKEDYFTQQNGSDLILYIGDKDIYLEPGEYTYDIKYTVPNQIAMLEDYDEIYWNAIGTDVQFNIENARAKVNIPEGASIVQETAYVGRFGARAKDYTRSEDYGQITYQVNRPLLPNEGPDCRNWFPEGFCEGARIIESVWYNADINSGYHLPNTLLYIHLV